MRLKSWLVGLWVSISVQAQSQLDPSVACDVQCTGEAACNYATCINGENQYDDPDSCYSQLQVATAACKVDCSGCTSVQCGIDCLYASDNCAPIATMDSFYQCLAETVANDCVNNCSPLGDGSHPSVQTEQVDCGGSYGAEGCYVPSSEACVESGGVPVARSGYAPTSNGCGPASGPYAIFSPLISAAAPQFDACCNQHDTCFGTCSYGNDVQFEDCNGAFASCLNEVCAKNYPPSSSPPSDPESPGAPTLSQICLSEADVYSQAVVGDGGCAAYSDAQGQACECLTCRKYAVSRLSVGGPSQRARKRAKGKRTVAI